MTQDVRAIDWHADSTDTVIRKIRAGEGHPGVLDAIGGREFHLFGAHRDRMLHGRPGELIARRHGAICRATVDGAVWITHLRRRDTATHRYFKLPAMDALDLAGVEPRGAGDRRSRSTLGCLPITPIARSPTKSTRRGLPAL